MACEKQIGKMALLQPSPSLDIGVEMRTVFDILCKLY